MREAIGRVVSILSIPYGFTVTIWSAGALTVTRLGAPSTLDVLLFVIGAGTAFVLLACLGWDRVDAEVPMRVSRAVLMNLFPIVAALAVIALPSRMVGRDLGYFANSFLATATYILCLAGLIRTRRPTGV